MPRSGSLGALALLGILVGGCTPTCDQSCKKLMRCEGLETDGFDADRCVEYCNNESDFYQTEWEDVQLQDALEEERRCIRDETCEAIAEGACYDERLYSF